jgi:putative transposase
MVLSERCRLIYNFGLAERKSAFKNGKNISYIDQQNDLPETKKKYPEYRWVYSKVLQVILQKLDADYRSFFALKKNGDQNAELRGSKVRNTLLQWISIRADFRKRWEN